MNLSNKLFTSQELEKEINLKQNDLKNDTAINDVFERMSTNGFYYTVENIINYLKTNYNLDNKEQAILILPKHDPAFCCELIGAVVREKYTNSNLHPGFRVDFYFWNEDSFRNGFEYVGIA